jgi:hypothetical protein
MENENREQTDWKKYLDDDFLYYYNHSDHTDTIGILGSSIWMTNQKPLTIASTPTHNKRLLVSAIVCSCAGEACRWAVK